VIGQNRSVDLERIRRRQAGNPKPVLRSSGWAKTNSRTQPYCRAGPRRLYIPVVYQPRWPVVDTCWVSFQSRITGRERSFSYPKALEPAVLNMSDLARTDGPIVLFTIVPFNQITTTSATLPPGKFAGPDGALQQVGNTLAKVRPFSRSFSRHVMRSQLPSGANQSVHYALQRP
jgi:hypothetical protein